MLDLAHILVHLRHVGGDFGDTGGGLSYISRNFLGGRALFLDGGGDYGGNRIKLADGGDNTTDGTHGRRGRFLDIANLLFNVFGGLRGLIGQIFDLVSFPPITGPGLI